MGEMGSSERKKNTWSVGTRAVRVDAIGRRAASSNGARWLHLCLSLRLSLLPLLEQLDEPRGALHREARARRRERLRVARLDHRELHREVVGKDGGRRHREP